MTGSAGPAETKGISNFFTGGEQLINAGKARTGYGFKHL